VIQLWDIGVQWVWPVVLLLTPAGLMGIAWEMYKARREARRHSRSAETAAYDNAYSRLEEHYIAFNTMLLQHAHLGVYVLDADREGLSVEDQSRRRILYEVLFAILERAYLDRERTADIFKHQWPGWEAFTRAYMKKSSCVAAWREWSGGYGADKRFEAFIDGIIKENEAAAPQLAAVG
jgi:hypothetical protein